MVDYVVYDDGIVDGHKTQNPPILVNANEKMCTCTHTLQATHLHPTKKRTTMNNH